MRDYYTVDEVAYLYGVSKELVFKWIRSGELEAEIIPDAMEEERYFSGRKMDTTYHGYAIFVFVLSCIFSLVNPHIYLDMICLYMPLFLFTLEQRYTS